MTILCDVDGVVADLLTTWLRRYNQMYDDSLTERDIIEWDMHRAVKPECGKRIYNFLRMPNLYSEVEPLPDALEGIQWLRDRGHRVVFVTSCVVGSLDQKTRWLQRHGFLSDLKDLVIAKDKALVRGDTLIDDAAHNMAGHPNGILVDYPYNRDFPWPRRAAGWPAICAQVELLEQGM